MNGTIQIFNQNGQSIPTLDSKHNVQSQSSLPFGLCVVGENLWVTFGKTIHIIDPHSFDTIQCVLLDGHDALGICHTRKGLILVVTIQSMILILNEHGHIMTVLESPKTVRVDYPAGICCNSKDEILISDHHNHRVQIFSLDGTFLRTLGSRGMGPNEFLYPRGICVDRDDNIFVADGENNRISIFGPTGIPIRQIPVSRPLGLCLTERKIIATSTNNFIAIFSN